MASASRLFITGLIASLIVAWFIASAAVAQTSPRSSGRESVATDLQQERARDIRRRGTTLRQERSLQRQYQQDRQFNNRLRQRDIQRQRNRQIRANSVGNSRLGQRNAIRRHQNNVRHRQRGQQLHLDHQRRVNQQRRLYP